MGIEIIGARPWTVERGTVSPRVILTAVGGAARTLTSARTLTRAKSWKKCSVWWRITI